MQALRHFLLALQFFTRIPVTGRLADWVGFSPAMLRASGGHFPGVGWIVGAVAAGVYAAVALALPHSASPAAAMAVAAVVSTIATVLLTGGFHEDGLGDVADGLGGSYDRERALAIMKDSRIGAFGAMALVLALLAKISLLALLGTHSIHTAFYALLAGHVLSRLWPMVVVRSLPHVGDTALSKSKPLAEQISNRGLMSAVLWSLPAIALLCWQQGIFCALLATLLSAAAAWWMRQWLKQRLQGFTGDGLGAVQQVSEIVFYLGLAIGLGPLAQCVTAWTSR